MTQEKGLELTFEWKLGYFFLITYCTVQGSMSPCGPCHYVQGDGNMYSIHCLIKRHELWGMRLKFGARFLKLHIF